MKEKKPIQVTFTAPRFFDAGMTAGLTAAEWEALTAEEKVEARLKYIVQQANTLAATPWHSEIGWPTNVHGRAKQLGTTARLALLALDAGDNHAAVLHALEAGKLMQEITRTIPAINESLSYRKKKQDRSIQVGEKTAEKRRKKADVLKSEVIELFHQAPKTLEACNYVSWITKEFNKDKKRTDKRTEKTIRLWLQEAGLLSKKK